MHPAQASRGGPVAITPYDPLRVSRWSSAGPLTTAMTAASSLSIGSGVIVIFIFGGSPDHVSPLSRSGTSPDIRCSYVKGGALFAGFWVSRLGWVGSLGS